MVNSLPFYWCTLIKNAAYHYSRVVDFQLLTICFESCKNQFAAVFFVPIKVRGEATPTENISAAHLGKKVG